MQHGLEIEDWAFWSPESRIPTDWLRIGELPNAGPVEAQPPDDLVPPVHRRRMSMLSKLAVQVALEASRRATPDFIVFASQHGELARTRELLTSIAAGTELSPASFSQSVHNTSAGLYTIVAKSRAPASSIAAGASTFAYGWIEAEVYLAANRGRRALLVTYDDAACSPEYRPYSPQTPCTYAAAFLLRRPRGTALCSRTPSPASGGVAPARAAIRCVVVYGRTEPHADGRRPRLALVARRLMTTARGGRMRARPRLPQRNCFLASSGARC